MTLPYEIPFADVQEALEGLGIGPADRLISVQFGIDEAVVEAIRTDDDGRPRFGIVVTHIPYKREGDR